MWFKRLPNKLETFFLTSICHNLTPVKKRACKKQKRMHVLKKENNNNNNINGTGLANKLEFNVYNGNFFFKNSQWSYRKYYSLPSTIDERSIALFSR